WTGSINGQTVVADHYSGPGGTWHRLGPWLVLPEDGSLEFRSVGDHANWSGLAIWRGQLEHHPDDAPPAPPAPPKEPTPGQIHFTQVIAPILSRHCLECHNPSETAGGIDLATAQGAAEAIVAGDPGSSELLLQVEDGEMPKKRP